MALLFLKYQPKDTQKYYIHSYYLYKHILTGINRIYFKE